MQESLQKAGVTLGAAVMLFAAEVSAKGWLEKKWGQLADAAHDVVTLGQHGRDRDRERAEAELRRVQEAREAAERLRQAKVDALLKDAALLRDVTRSFESSAKAVRDIELLQGEILVAATAELAAREQSVALVERVRNYMRSDRNDVLQVLDVLTSVPFLTEADLTAAFGPPGARDASKLETLKAKQQVAVDALKAKVSIVEKSGATEAVLLEQALKRIKTEGLKAIISLASTSRLRLQTLGASLEASRKKYRQQLAVQLDALVALQAGDRAALGAKWEEGLRPVDVSPVGADRKLTHL